MVKHLNSQISQSINATSAAIASSKNLVETAVHNDIASQSKYSYIRGLGDLKAVKYCYHSKKINILLQKKYQKSLDIEEYENLRLAIIAAQTAKGVCQNMQALIENEIETFFAKNFPKAYLQKLKAIKLQILAGLVPGIADLIESLDFKFVKRKITSKDKIFLRENLYQQYEFIEYLLKRFDFLKTDQKNLAAKASKASTVENTEQFKSELSLEAEQDIGENLAKESEKQTDKKLEEKQKTATHFFGAPNRLSFIKQKALQYKVYSTEYDRVVRPVELLDVQSLKQNRLKLDAKLQDLQEVTRHAANKLRRKLLAQHNVSWRLNLEEGQIDASRLANLVANPTFKKFFKKTNHLEDLNSCVSILIDNSGSMRGRPISVAALCADILVRELQKCNVATEVLGFTTTDWQGGKLKKRFEASNSNQPPGRLNGLLHIIYKDLKENYKKSRNNLGLLLEPSFLKENIDGEALIWAANRLVASEAKKKILVVISDGAPIDEASLSYNGSNFLEQHLLDVIHTIERNKNINLIAIGIGHEVGKYYSKAITIKQPDELCTVLFEQLEKNL